jgi:hypothetical protein
LGARASGVIGEAMECLGGNGYVEESVLPRLYREAPVNAIWEGSGNVMCLDVLRALGHDGEAACAVLAALGEEAADLPGTRAALAFLERAFAAPDVEAQARAAVDGLAVLAAAAALRQGAPEVATPPAHAARTWPWGALRNERDICRGSAPDHRTRLAVGRLSTIIRRFGAASASIPPSVAGLSDGYLYDPNLRTRTANDRRRIPPVMTSMSMPVRCSAPTISIRMLPRAVIAI